MPICGTDRGLFSTASIVSQKGRNWQFDFVYCWFDFSANAAPSWKQEDQSMPEISAMTFLNVSSSVAETNWTEEVFPALLKTAR